MPKAVRYAVWKKAIADYAPHLKGVYSGLRIYNQTDLGRDRRRNAAFQPPSSKNSRRRPMSSSSMKLIASATAVVTAPGQSGVRRPHGHGAGGVLAKATIRR